MKNKNKTNGQAVTAEIVTPELSNLGVGENQKNLEPTPHTQTIEDRLNKLNSLLNLSEKREKLFISSQKLDSFILASDEEISNFTITDKNGNRFSTGNPGVINKVLEVVKGELMYQLEKVESEIIF